MWWCRYHGILTPATLWKYEKGEKHTHCGYLTVPHAPSSACVAEVYDLENWQIDHLESYLQRGIDRRG